MFHLCPIDSFDRPELQPYRTMRYQFEHRQQGIFVAEGEKVVRRLLESRLGVVSVVLPEKWVAEYRPLLEGRPEDVPVYVAPKKLLETLTGFSMYQGLLAVGRVPPPPALEELLAAGPSPLLLVAAQGMSNALNLGALVRNCAAFGAHALLVGPTCCSPFLRRAVRASMGTVFSLPVIELGNPAPPAAGDGLWVGPGPRPPAAAAGDAALATSVAGVADPGLAFTLRGLRARGVRVVAAHPHASGRTLAQADFTGDCCVVLGSEGEGISMEVLAACDDQVAIPMPPEVDSLNVASASAVFLYEVVRQRGG